jgi:hypothetical protein
VICHLALLPKGVLDPLRGVLVYFQIEIPEAVRKGGMENGVTVVGSAVALGAWNPGISGLLFYTVSVSN